MIEMDIKVYASILLVARIISMYFNLSVIKRQLELFKLPIDKEIKHYRVILFVLSVAIFVGNLIPAIIDILTITGELERSTQTVNGVSLVYTSAWVVSSLLSSFLIYRLYRMSHQVDETHSKSDHTLMNDENK